MTGATIAKVAGAVTAAAIASMSAYAAGRGASSAPAPAASAQPTISAPAATSADIAALRQHFDRRFDAQQSQITAVATDLAGVKGYIDAQKQAAMEKAVAGRQR